MGKKKESGTKSKKKEESGMKGNLKLQKADGNQARFIADGPVELFGNRVFELDRELLPKDYEPALYDVTGEIEIRISVKKK